MSNGWVACSLVACLHANVACDCSLLVELELVFQP